MCIIAYQPAGSETLTEARIRTLWANNPDGAGYAFALNGEVILRKPFWHLRDLLKAYRSDHAEFGKVAPFVVHLRVATHGGKTEQNTHPHIVGRGRAVVAHNGIISCKIPDPTMSDTVAFCRAQLARVRMHKLVAQPMRDDLSRQIGAQNKLVILAADGAVSIVNERGGVWEGGCWYSNSYSLISSSDRFSWSPRGGYKPEGRKGWKGAPRYYQPRSFIETDNLGLERMRQRIAQTLGCTPAELTDDEEQMIEAAAMDISTDPENVGAILDDLADDIISGCSEDDDDRDSGALMLMTEWTDAQGREWEEYMDVHGRLSVRRVF